MQRVGVVASSRVLGLGAIVSLVFGVGGSTAQEVVKPEVGSGLSSRLYEIATDPSLRHLAPADLNQALALSPHGPGSLERDGNSILVEIRTAAHTKRAAESVRATGNDVVNVDRDFDTVTALVELKTLAELGQSPGVANVNEVLAPMVNSARDAADTSVINTCAGSVTTEADTQMRAATARNQFDVDGTGVKVGVLSDSYDISTTDRTSAAQDVASGDLPGPGNPCGRTKPVQVLAESTTGGEDEGRGMAQLVHDLAPGADLAFATGNGGQDVMAANIRGLAAAGAKVIVDDLTYFTEPMFQDGPISAAVNAVTAQGVTYYSSAANANHIVGGNNIGAYETPQFRPNTCPAALGGANCMDFDPGGGAPDGTFAVGMAAGTVSSPSVVRIPLNWAEPQNGVTTDLDLHMLNAAGTALLFPGSESVDANTGGGTQRPSEFLSVQNTGAAFTFTLAITRAAGVGTPRLKFLTLGDITSYEYPTSSGGDLIGQTIFGHNGAANAVTAAAVRFSDATKPEDFSSRGPVVTYFNPVSGTTPATANTQALAKPDIAATDGGQTTFFFDDTAPFTQPIRFFGTSAAAPDAAAVAALQLSANPSQTVDQIKAAQKSTAVAVGAFGPTAVGAGLINAVGAVGANPPLPPTVSGFIGGNGTDSTPTISFTVSGDAKTLTCSLDGGVGTPCSSPFTAPTLADGSHRLDVTATDFFGQAGSGSTSFSIDTTGPAAPSFSKKPKKKTSSRKAKFAFSSETGAVFACSLDKKAFSPCTSPTQVKVKKAKPKAKKHTFAVEAMDSLGNIGATSTYKWKVQKKKKSK